uniref:G_PROTEIN_RECEP_F1_2 domain-containing protein n=1 Tax=Parastrongyloides trichosuri TaxID=131310 RepID=A0A0N4ZD35_PARTI
MDYLSQVITSTNLIIGIVLTPISIYILCYHSPENQNKNYTYLLIVQNVIGFLTAITQELTSFYALILDKSFLLVFKHLPHFDCTREAIFLSIIVYLSYLNIAFIGGMVIARHTLICTKNGLSRMKAFAIFIILIVGTLPIGVACFITINKEAPNGSLGEWLDRLNISLILVDKTFGALHGTIVSFG